MGVFDFFDPDALLKKLDDVEHMLEKALDGVDATASKIENTAGVIEKQLDKTADDFATSATTAQPDESTDNQ